MLLWVDVMVDFKVKCKKKIVVASRVTEEEYLVIRREAMLNKQKISDFIRGRLL